MSLRRRAIFCAFPIVAVLGACAGGAQPPVSSPEPPAGVFHPLEQGMTLYSLSRAYTVPVDTLVAANGIQDPANIPAGTPIFIPGAPRRIEIPIAPGGGGMGWPLKGRVTSGYGSRGPRRHTGIDIDGDTGDTIRAAAGGKVIRAGNDGRYGLSVLVDHGRGLTTLYAHASKLHVKRGDHVKAGDIIALVGRSGNASGSHLHFEVRRNDRPVDPLPFLQ